MSFRPHIQRTAWSITTSLLLVAIIWSGWVIYRYQSARLDLTKEDDQYTAARLIEIESREIHVESVGFLDSITFFQAVVTPESAAAKLANLPEISRFGVPNCTPLWWKLSLWWHARDSDTKYFQTNDRWPSKYAYCKQKNLLFGVQEYPLIKD